MVQNRHRAASDSKQRIRLTATARTCAWTDIDDRGDRRWLVIRFDLEGAFRLGMDYLSSVDKLVRVDKAVRYRPLRPFYKLRSHRDRSLSYKDLYRNTWGSHYRDPIRNLPIGNLAYNRFPDIFVACYISVRYLRARAYPQPLFPPRQRTSTYRCDIGPPRMPRLRHILVYKFFLPVHRTLWPRARPQPVRADRR